MSYNLEHAARLKDPKLFKDFRKEDDKFGQGICVIWGIHEDDKIELQSIHFNKDNFTVAEAKAWLKKHDYCSTIFEPATGGKGEIIKMPIKHSGAVKTVSIELQNFKSADEEDRVIEGYFSTADLDRGGDISLPSAFEKTMEQFMKNPLLMYMHNWGKAIGVVTDYKIDEKGVWIKAKLGKGIPAIDEVWSLIQQGIIKAFSYGYRVIDSVAEKIDGKNVTKLLEVELFEVSIVTIPMNQNALFTVSPDGGLKSVAFRREVKDLESPATIRLSLDEYTEEEAIIKAKELGYDAEVYFQELDSLVFNKSEKKAPEPLCLTFCISSTDYKSFSEFVLDNKEAIYKSFSEFVLDNKEAIAAALKSTIGEDCNWDLNIKEVEAETLAVEDEEKAKEQEALDRLLKQIQETTEEFKKALT